MNYPREVWISEELHIISIWQEFDAQADVVATSNLPLSATGGSVDGQTMMPGTKVLATAQTTPAQNGLYLVPNSGAWSPVTIQQPEMVEVLYGDSYAGTKWSKTAPNVYANVAVTGYVATAVRDEQYCQVLGVDARKATSKVAEPGARSKRTLVSPDGFAISLNAFYERKSQQWTPYLDEAIRYRVRFYLVNPRYETNENDDHVYRNCAITGQKIASSDDKVIEVALQLDAETEE